MKWGGNHWWTGCNIIITLLLLLVYHCMYNCFLEGAGCLA
jgi:hypothetical protein